MTLSFNLVSFLGSTLKGPALNSLLVVYLAFFNSQQVSLAVFHYYHFFKFQLACKWSVRSVQKEHWENFTTHSLGATHSLGL